MSSELFRALDFLEVGAVACFCSLGAATLTELLFPAYDSRRNPVWQSMEGVLGMVFHYLVGLEAFTLLCPLRYIPYPATVFAVFSPVMIPNTLAKMSNAMEGLAGLVRPVATWSPPSPVGPPRPLPGSLGWDEWLKKQKDGAARAIVDLKARMSADMDAEVARQVEEQIDALEAQMRVVLGEAYTDYMASRDAKVKQAHDRLQQQWAMALSSLRQSVAQLKAKAGFANQCLTEGARMVTNEGYKQSGVAPFCRECPEGYSYQPKNGDENEQYQLATVVGGLVCKPTDVSSDPVIPVDPTRPPLAKGTFAYTGDKYACRDTIAGYWPQYPSVDECGRQESCMETTNPVTGEKEATLCQCTPEGLTDTERDELYSEPSRSEFISVVDPANPRKTKCARCRPVVQGGVSPVVHYTLPDGSTRTCGAG